ncbi:hypothetical protein GSI_10897 [Ganoderma sinense ZZ0214-1]|uniref:Uncharacterized protein n=1 Tax=Ganoderma sinense ZZ0214-1 TaxID=1077348 RepID=A0A2G8S1X4_9APHY|nr:hypothetical protein GSI_10897 [Ganoderma sinense ZZ0214-1]
MVEAVKPDITEEVEAAAREPLAADESACSQGLVAHLERSRSKPLYTSAVVAVVDYILTDLDGEEGVLHGSVCISQVSKFLKFRQFFDVIRT